MDGSRYTVTLDEFKLFHGIDRALYRILVRDLFRNPVECLYILGLWLWLERGGFSNLVSHILSLPPLLIDELADEAVTCLKCLNTHFPFSSEASEIPLTHSLAKKDISLQYFYERQLTAFNEIQDIVKGVCIPSVSELMDTGYRYSGGSPVNAASSSVDQNSFTQSISSLRIKGDARVNDDSQNERTMFVTFSKGYPVSEAEVRQFFMSLFGNCIESFQMQEVGPVQQALYAKIVFLRPVFIQNILNGVSKAKFTINGKNVWMRRFVVKEEPAPVNMPVPCVP
ncbi:hypothetical protein PHJA_000693600 [Phtheirospermum japonicum]|uniref:Uncharacterized protein n=1 Tax=Phtheirospermum japonicum TaxID=374723 RepID=A0A830BK91_9LAMI|nr:hypothetical protein PHJA_000693600 [Phtheirospermum japonicum]